MRENHLTFATRRNKAHWRPVLRQQRLTVHFVSQEHFGAASLGNRKCTLIQLLDTTFESTVGTSEDDIDSVGRGTLVAVAGALDTLIERQGLIPYHGQATSRCALSASSS